MLAMSVLHEQNVVFSVYSWMFVSLPLKLVFLALGVNCVGDYLFVNVHECNNLQKCCSGSFVIIISLNV